MKTETELNERIMVLESEKKVLEERLENAARLTKKVVHTDLVGWHDFAGASLSVFLVEQDPMGLDYIEKKLLFTCPLATERENSQGITDEHEWNKKLKCLFDAMVEVYDEWPDGRAAVELTTQRYLGEREEEQD